MLAGAIIVISDMSCSVEKVMGKKVLVSASPREINLHANKDVSKQSLTLL